MSVHQLFLLENKIKLSKYDFADVTCTFLYQFKEYSNKLDTKIKYAKL